MKKLILLAIILLGLSIGSPAFALEKIDNFEVTIKINSDSTIEVQEQIEYDFGSEQKHGIFRDIPIKYNARGGNYNLRISGIKVIDQDGTDYKFTTSYPGKNIQIKIGDPDQYVSGKKTYRLQYKIRRAINFFDSHDELYWNATGNEWTVTIEKASTLISLPKEVADDNLQKDCFFGPSGSTSECDFQSYQYNQNNLVSNIAFENGPLLSGEGLTIVVGFPKGLVTPPSKLQSFLDTLRDNGILFLPILVLGILIYLWRTRGRDPAGRGTIVAQFDPPDNLTPAEVGTIIDEKADKKDLSAEIINLAVKGYLKIIRQEAKGVFKKDDYVLEKLKEKNDLPNSFEKKLMESLFSEEKKSVALSSLKNKFYKDLEDIKNKVYLSTVDKKYFLKNPRKVRMTYLGFGLALLFLGLFIGFIFGGLGVVSFLLSGIITIIFSFFMPAKTKEGVLAKEHILGLKRYLTVAEKERLKFHNAPKKDPKHFEKLLPYAIVLGVEKEWAKQFEGIYNQKPAWYQDSTGRYFTAFVLVNSLNSFQTHANTNLSSRPSQAAGGGSGFGGGGFSGGGFGGGGGGSW